MKKGIGSGVGSGSGSISQRYGSGDPDPHGSPILLLRLFLFFFLLSFRVRSGSGAGTDTILKFCSPENLKKTVSWIGIVLMLIRIRISILMPTQIRIRIGIKTMAILMRIHKPEYFFYLFTSLPDYNVNVTHQCQMCHNFQYVGHNIEIFWKKVKFINFLILL
jgi:hypothetical protein